MVKDKREIVKSFIYVVPLKRVYWGRRTNRTDRAVKLVREFVRRHTKVDRIIIYNEVNKYIWSKSREKPPRRIKVLVLVEKEKVESEEEEEKKEILVARVKLAPEKAKPGPFELKTGGGKAA